MHKITVAVRLQNNRRSFSSNAYRCFGAELSFSQNVECVCKGHVSHCSSCAKKCAQGRYLTASYRPETANVVIGDFSLSINRKDVWFRVFCAFISKDEES